MQPQSFNEAVIAPISALWGKMPENEERAWYGLLKDYPEVRLRDAVKALQASHKIGKPKPAHLIEILGERPVSVRNERGDTIPHAELNKALVKQWEAAKADALRHHPLASDGYFISSLRVYGMDGYELVLSAPSRYIACTMNDESKPHAIHLRKALKAQGIHIYRVYTDSRTSQTPEERQAWQAEYAKWLDVPEYHTSIPAKLAAHYAVKPDEQLEQPVF